MTHVSIDDTELNLNDILVHGTVQIEFAVDVQGYNSVRDPGDAKFFNVNSGYIIGTFSYVVTFDAKRPTNLELAFETYRSELPRVDF